MRVEGAGAGVLRPRRVETRLRPPHLHLEMKAAGIAVPITTKPATISPASSSSPESSSRRYSSNSSQMLDAHPIGWPSSIFNKKCVSIDELEASDAIGGALP